MGKHTMKRKSQGGGIFSALFRRTRNRINTANRQKQEDREIAKKEREGILEGKGRLLVNGEYCYPKETVELVNKCRKSGRFGYYRFRHRETCQTLDTNFPKKKVPTIKTCSPEDVSGLRSYEEFQAPVGTFFDPVYALTYRGRKVATPVTVYDKAEPIIEDTPEEEQFIDKEKITSEEDKTEGGTIRRRQKRRKNRKTKRRRNSH